MSHSYILLRQYAVSVSYGKAVVNSLPKYGNSVAGGLLHNLVTRVQHQAAWRTCLRRHFARPSKACRVHISQAVCKPQYLLAFSLPVTLSAVSLHKHRLFGQALCEPSSSNTRVLPTSGEATELEFPWIKFLKLLLPDIWFLIGAILSALAVAVVNVEMPLLLGDLVNVLSTRTSTGHHGNFMDNIRQPVIHLMRTILAQSALTACYISLLSTMGERLATRMRKRLFESFIEQDIQFFDKHKSGELINRLTTDVQDFKSSFKSCVSQGLRSLTQTLGCAVALFRISPKLTGVLVVVVPGIILIGVLFGSLLRVLSRAAQSQVSVATGVANEAIGNVRTVRAFAMEVKEMEIYGKEIDHSSRLNKLLGMGIAVFQGLSNLALNGIVIGILYMGGVMMSNEEIRPGDLMSFLVAAQTMQKSLAQMSLLFGQVVRGLSAGARVFEYMNLDSRMQTGTLTIPYHSMMGNVEFRDVNFTYPARPNQLVLNKFNLSIPGGSIVALVGLSGNGKSTAAALLDRFYDVDSGSILLDGHDIRSLDPKWLRGNVMAFINQEPVLFACTVRENIRYGLPEASDSEVVEAAKQANAHDFITQFPHGYDTVLGERGVTVSGGQKQRIAIARALIKKPTVLILDEATSALDAESERIVQDTLDKVIKGHTVLVIAHRLSTIRDADIIAVVSQGQIAEMGTHDELKRKKGLYWNLIKKQENEDGRTHG